MPSSVLHLITALVIVFLSSVCCDQEFGDSNIVEVSVLPSPNFVPTVLPPDEVERTVVRTVAKVSEKIGVAPETKTVKIGDV